MPFEQFLMRHRREELLEVNQDDIALTAIMAEMPTQIFFEYPLGKLKSLSG